MNLINFGSNSRDLGYILQSRGLKTNSWWPWFALKWTQHNFLNAHFGDSGPKYSPTSLKTKRVADSACLASWVWQTSGRYSGTWGIFSSPRNSKLTPDGLGLQWNRRRKTFWTLTFEFVGRNIATLYFKTETVAETAFRASWFWSTSARFPGSWGIFSSSGDPKLTFDSFGLQ